MLHIVNKSPYEKSALASCLAHATKGSAVLLIEDGVYAVVQGGTVVSAQTIPVPISKTGVLAEIFSFAHDYSAAYGILAIIFAVLAGLGANAVFRKM